MFIMNNYMIFYNIHELIVKLYIISLNYDYNIYLCINIYNL